MDSEYKLRGSTKAKISSEKTAQPREEPQAPGGAYYPGPGVRKPRGGTLKKGDLMAKEFQTHFREKQEAEKNKNVKA